MEPQVGGTTANRSDAAVSDMCQNPVASSTPLTVGATVRDGSAQRDTTVSKFS